jgi:NitT/TauT family transport system permease protein
MTKRALVAGTASVGVLLVLWQIGAVLVASPFILPGPVPVFFDALALVTDASFHSILGATFARGFLSFSISLILSFILGLLSGMNESFSAMLRPWMSAIKATPVVSIILIALLWFGSSNVPIFVSILMTMPVMTEAIAHGVKSSDTKLLEMAEVYRFSKKKILMNIRLPSALPFFLAGAGSSLGLTWKVVVAGEILSSPKFGLGSAMQTAKVHLETARVFSLTVTAILLSIATEILFDFFVKLSKSRSSTTAGN